MSRLGSFVIAVKITPLETERERKAKQQIAERRVQFWSVLIVHLRIMKQGSLMTLGKVIQQAVVLLENLSKMKGYK